ncbi:alpha/beta fold hydrolase [Actinopolymorpha pittospori]|uniref:Pimeloyl-ACP methyl ester carboxylesterase n=1 Tax=Actinopolymorpha pittospori TaxID=648752 RepID=A0A927RD98_9ACTN|nr:alpha/beta hydrolase [Actinopolymorpha pittospori]MBE1610789.1 pimeloyl-ACP methyl ester carboxylesterase [Actinopolymorpha pittospori]
MADYVRVNGVSMWYDDRGAGEPVVLLHGGLSDARDFAGNLDTLAGGFRLLLPECRAHGHTADVPGPLSLAVMAQDIVAFLERVVGGPARLVGYSAGAGVALRVALDRPDLVERLVLVSGAFHTDGLILRPSAEGEPPPLLVAAYAEVSPDGAGHFPAVIAKVVDAVAEEDGLEPADLAGVNCRTLVMAGDDDLVRLEHTVALYHALPDAQLAIVPGTSHLLLLGRPDECVRLVSDFLTSEARPTLMPIRRAGIHVG